MPPGSTDLHAPITIVWCALAGVCLLMSVMSRRRVSGTNLGLGWSALLGSCAVTLSPPARGFLPGMGRAGDIALPTAPLPWDWGTSDNSLLVAGLLSFAGVVLAPRRRAVAAAALVTVFIEAVQYAVPSLAEACSLSDLLQMWLALAVGAFARVAATRMRHNIRRVTQVAAFAVAGALLTSFASITGSSPRAAADPTTRVPLSGQLFHQDAAPLTEVDRRWVEAGIVPGAGTPFADMSRVALLDIRRLTRGLDYDLLPAAGPARKWEYFWPRDGAFLAVALARTGHVDRARDLLDRTAMLYLNPVRGFDARYQLSGERVRDDPRDPQPDGCGWMLWAIHETGLHVRLPASVVDLRDRCTDQLLRVTGGGDHLPKPAPDYWEQRTQDRLLGVAAPISAGLRCAATDYIRAGDADRGREVAAAAAGVRTELARYFGPRYLRAGTHGGLDAATAMLMPPFDPQPLAGARDAWVRYQQEASRPAGGLAPGSEWKQDGISWTPEVALVAYTAAAAGDDGTARRWLTWLDAHRAAWGSLPEKVDSAGRPGGPAPLGWTSALVLLTLTELDD